MAVTGPDAPSPGLRDQIAAALIAELVTCDTAEVVDAVLPVVTAAQAAAWERGRTSGAPTCFSCGVQMGTLGRVFRCGTCGSIGGSVLDHPIVAAAAANPYAPAPAPGPARCDVCQGTGSEFVGHGDCGGCSGLPSPEHEPACGVEPCPRGCPVVPRPWGTMPTPAPGPGDTTPTTECRYLGMAPGHPDTCGCADTTPTAALCGCALGSCKPAEHPGKRCGWCGDEYRINSPDAPVHVDTAREAAGAATLTAAYPDVHDPASRARAGVEYATTELAAPPVPPGPEDAPDTAAIRRGLLRFGTASSTGVADALALCDALDAARATITARDSEISRLQRGNLLLAERVPQVKAERDEWRSAHARALRDREAVEQEMDRRVEAIEHTPGARCVCPAQCTAPWCDAVGLTP